MSKIKDTFFGGSEKRASRKQKESIRRGISEVRGKAEEARGVVTEGFGRAGETLRAGQQAALDVFGLSIPEQLNVFQGGNVGAQEALLAGVQPFQSAILGTPGANLSGFQPTRLPIDTSFAQQTLPALQQDALVPATTPGPFSPNQIPDFVNPKIRGGF